MSRYLDPKADVVFKRIFGDHPHLLISLLNALLPLPSDSPIVELSYLPTEQVPLIPAFKRNIADVKCKDAKGRIFIVEMQMNWTDTFKQRLLFGASQAFVKQIEKEKDSTFLQPVYGLGLVAETYDNTTTDWYQYYPVVKKDNSEGDIIEHLQLIFIELPKMPIQSPDEKKLRRLWIRFLREIDENTKAVSPELLDVPEISEAIGLAEEAFYTAGELALYETYWDSVRTEKTRISDAEAKGLSQGLALAQGLAQRSVEIAMNMIKANRPVTEICQFTGLSEDVIATLKHQR